MTIAPSSIQGKKVAIVTDWLTVYGGAEKVVKSVHELFPDAPIFTSQYSEKGVSWFRDCDVRTGWLNVFPASLRKVLLLPRAWYFHRLHRSLKDYDIIITICIAESKGVKLAPHQVGVCYLQGPPAQYLWGMYDQYMANPGFGMFNPLARVCFWLLLRPLRAIDRCFARRPTAMLANSTYSANEVQRYYHRSAAVVFPPVAVDRFSPDAQEDYFITTSRQVNWKRLDLAIQACIETGDRLVLIGDGAEHESLRRLAAGHDNIIFIPPIHQPEELARYVARAKAFLFPSIEPFGIAPIESLSAGVPVVALARGGALDYIKDGVNGVFFTEQTVASMRQAIERLQEMSFDKAEIQASAQRFSEQSFRQQFMAAVQRVVEDGR